MSVCVWPFVVYVRMFVRVRDICTSECVCVCIRGSACGRFDTRARNHTQKINK